MPVNRFCLAVRRNVDLTLIVHDNMILGLTTGQTTATGQLGFRTKSTPYGSTVMPLNPIAHALVSNGTFVARGFAGDPKHLTFLLTAALNHKGFNYIEVFQPCVTFNYLNTYEWFRQRLHKLEEAGHDPTDRKKALEKSLEWGNHIPIGIFYKDEQPTYGDYLPRTEGAPMTNLQRDEAAISKLIESLK